MTCLSAPHLTGVAPCVTVCVILLSQIPLFFSSKDRNGIFASCNRFNLNTKCFFCFFFVFFFWGGGGVCLFVFCFVFALHCFCFVCVCFCTIKLPCGVNKKNKHKDKIRISCRWFEVHNQYLLQQVEYMYVYALIKV